MAIDWKTIISEFDGKPTLLQAIGKLRKAVEEETITIQQAQAEIAKLESQQKVDEQAIATAQTNANNALSLAATCEKDIGTLDGQVAELEQNKVDKIKSQSEYVRLYGVSKDAKETIYEGSELNAPWKFVRRDANGNIQISSSKKSSDAVTRGELDVDLAAKQKILSAEKSFVFNGKEVKAPSFYGGEMLVSNGIKTLFGNESIYGKGNIDLYKHHIVLTSNGEKGFFNFYSSKSTKCDSLTDLKTLLGNTFEVEVCGQYSFKDSGDNDRFYRYAYITETTIFVEKVHTTQGGDLDNNYPTIGTDSNVTWSGITITDTVTTI